MIVFSKLLKGRADADLWYSTRSGADWSIPKLIPGINTLGNELFPSFIGDSLFTFSTDGIIGYGGLDIFSVPFKGEWMDITEKEIKRLPLPLNSVGDDFWLYNLTVDSLVLNSNRTGGKGEDDIYSYRKPIPEVVPEPEPEPVVEITPVKPTFDIDAFLKDCNSKRIYFAFKDGATEEQFDFVDKLKELIDEGYKLKIQITGYADARGTTAVNYEVGMKRANYVKNSLIQKGIPGNILKTVSMGSTKIENKCRTQWIQCTEEEHRQNRYVQLTISKAD
jgi:outer membrane protein OmpA-like peptidoglycan-associated protein